jgi:hypothetical protein
MIIARRSVSLSKTYLIIGVGLTLVGLLFLSLSSLVSSPTTGALAQGTSRNSAEGVPFLAVPFQTLASYLFCTPVLMLFVYDKNNGVLEYLLSLGMNQRDIYRQYLKAALILAGALVSFDIVIDVVIGLVEGTAGLTLGIAVLVAVFALSAVSLGTLLMMSFSSLQKQRMGSNQPLGMTLGALVVFPSYFLPLAFPSFAFWIDLTLAGVVAVLSLVTFSLSTRLIKREKLLP